MDNINLYGVVLAGGLLSACTNPALLDRAGGPVALDRLAGAACEVAQPPTESLPEQSRGLYEQAHAHADAPRSSSTRDYSRDASGRTSVSGSYAIQVELDVYAQEDQSAVSAQYDPTRDRATLLLRADIDQESDVALRLCGLDLPTRYAYATSTASQLLVPDDAWDRDSMPAWSSRIHPAKAAQGAQLQLDAFAIQLGIALPDPGATWPSYEETPELECGVGRSGISCFPDHDSDGQPGLTLVASANSELVDAPYPACHAWSYAAPSTQPEPWLSDNNDGAKRTFVGLRTALQLFLNLDESCKRGSGSVIAEDILTRTFDCELTSGSRCTSYQATALDARAPSFHVLAKRETPPSSFHDSRDFIDEALDRTPSDGGSVSVQRLEATDATACTAVRAAFGR